MRVTTIVKSVHRMLAATALLILACPVATAQNPFPGWGAAGEAAQALQQGTELIQQSRAEEALPYLYQAERIYRQTGDTYGLAQAVYWIGSSHFGLRHYEEAVPVLVEAVELGRAVRLQQLLAPAHMYLGSTYWALGKRSVGMQHLDESRQIARRIGDGYTETMSTMVLANNHLFSGDYGKAMTEYKETLRLAERQSDVVLKMSAQGGLSTMYKALDQSDLALEHAERALELARSGPDRALEVHYACVLAARYRETGRVQEALQLVQDALTLARRTQDNRDEGSALFQLGQTWDELGETAKALSAFEESAAQGKNMPELGSELSSLRRIAEIYLETGDYESALQAFNESAKVAAQTEDQVATAGIANGLAKAKLAMGDVAGAERHLAEALTIYASQGVQELSDRERMGLFQDQQESYALFQDVLVRQGKIRDALAIAEQGRARALRMLLAERLSAEDEQRIGDDQITVQEIEAIAARLNTVLVEYSVIGSDAAGASKLFVWVIRPGSDLVFRAIEFDGMAETLPTLVRGARSAIGVRGVFKNEESRAATATTTDVQDNQSRLQRLHAVLIEPIAEFLPTEAVDPVMFLPHAELFMVPFAALKDADGQYLVDKHTIVSAPSVQVLQHTERQSAEARRGKGMVIVGDPKMPALPPQFGDATLSQLPGTAKEARRIAELLNAKALIGRRASETEVTRRMSSARIIHLATHGLLDDFGSGIPGAIALAPSRDDDGLLTAMEIFGMRLDADLVVLSACDTGLGHITGDGVVGLSRSLIAAGTASTVVSLWQVPDDPTAMLMIAFYENLTGGMSKAEALRQAMLATKERYPDPYSWAAFTLIGEFN